MSADEIKAEIQAHKDKMKDNSDKLTAIGQKTREENADLAIKIKQLELVLAMLPFTADTEFVTKLNVILNKQK